MTRLTAPSAGVFEGLPRALLHTVSSVEEVSRLAGQAQAAASAVRAGSWTGHTCPALSVHIGALGTVPPTFGPEKKVAFNAAVADGSVFCGARLTACFTAHTLHSVWVKNLAYVTGGCLAASIVQLVVVLTLGTDAGIGAQLTVVEAGQAGRHTSVRVQATRTVRHTAIEV